MTREELLKGFKLIGKFMENPFIDGYSEEGLLIMGHSYAKSWDNLIPVCDKIIRTYSDKRSKIFRGLITCDIDLTLEAVIEFLFFWYDETQEKITSSDEEIREQQLRWINQSNN